MRSDQLNIKDDWEVLGFGLLFNKEKKKRHTQKNVQGDHTDTQMKACTHTQSRKLLNKNGVSVYSWHPGSQGQTKHINFEILTTIDTQVAVYGKIYKNIYQAVVQNRNYLYIWKKKKNNDQDYGNKKPLTVAGSKTKIREIRSRHSADIWTQSGMEYWTLRILCVEPIKTCYA
jgi:hypothetical protein